MTPRSHRSIERNLAYFAARLADPRLLGFAYITESGDLAVPVSDTRRGGWVSVDGPAEARRLIARMREQPGLFPGPRMMYGGVCVGFGPDAPDDDAAAGRHYGYSDAAITAFMQRIARKEQRS